MKDLIPSGHVDIHSHILPGIDDGAANIDASLALLEPLVAAGHTKLVGTPHIMYTVYENTPDTIGQALQVLQEATSDRFPGITISAAAEYMLDSNFPNLLAQSKLLTIKDNYLLVEMSYLNPPLHLHQMLFDIQVAGYIPVLAHPERYAFYHRNKEELRKLKNSGCKFQLNLLSVAGYYGPPVAETAMWLLREGLIDYVGSDVHHQNHIACLERRVLLKDIKPLEDALRRNRKFR